MKYLITFDTETVSRLDKREWNVDDVIFLSNLSELPHMGEPSIFFVPTVSNHNNSLAYDGVALALRILMHYLKEEKTDVDIVLIGNESQENFLLHYDYPNILKIPGFNYVRFNQKLVREYSTPRKRQLKPKDYLIFTESWSQTIFVI